jgi:glycosyltransferase involved in cell wall biosynthesis
VTGLPALSVVIPTRNRPRELERCLRALGAQDLDLPFEIIVVDDSDSPALNATDHPAGLRLLRTSGGVGPARARNLGIAAALGDVVVFTDDDTIPSTGWLRAVVEYLAAHSLAIGVEGPTHSEPYDALTQHSIDSRVPGAYLTCNIAYRKEILAMCGGFYEGFPYPHCEDLDLGLRTSEAGELGFSERMLVVHPPRDMPAPDQIRRGRMIASEVILRDRHPASYLDYRWLPARLRPIAGLVRARARLLRDDINAGDLRASRVARWTWVTIAQTVVGTTACLRVERTLR